MDQAGGAGAGQGDGELERGRPEGQIAHSIHTHAESGTVFDVGGKFDHPPATQTARPLDPDYLVARWKVEGNDLAGVQLRRADPSHQDCVGAGRAGQTSVPLEHNGNGAALMLGKGENPMRWNGPELCVIRRARGAPIEQYHANNG